MGIPDAISLRLKRFGDENLGRRMPGPDPIVI